MVYIYKIIIKNFRGIKDLEWKPREGINIIIGENGCGKSTIGEALNYLLNPYINWYNKTLSEFEYYNRNMSEPILIEVWLKSIENLVLEDGELLLEHIDEDDKISEQGENLILITRFIGDREGSTSHSIVSNGKEYPLRQKYKGVVNYKFIEADRDPSKELSFYKNSILSKVLDSDSLNSVIADIIDDFNNNSSRKLMDDPHFKSNIERFGSSLADFNLIDSNEDAIKIEVTELNETKTLKSFSLSSRMSSESNHLPFKYQSRGIQNLMLMVSLQEVLSDDGILFLEEPEQNLEPFMQRKLIKNLSSSNRGQVFFTTHSIEIAKEFKFENIFLMKSGNIQSLPNPKDIDEKFESRIERIAKSQLISGLFAKGILLVEGESELSGIPVFSQELDKGLEYIGVETIMGEGKDSALKYASYYSKCGKPIVSLVDNDKDINDLIKKYEKKNVSCLILKLPKDYEGALVSTDRFQAIWKALFEEFIPFKKYKDIYLRPFINENSKSTILKSKWVEIEAEKNDWKTLEDIVNLLDSDEVLEYQREFLHLNLAGIREARDVANYLVSTEDGEHYDYIIPIAFTNMIKVIGKYINNGNICGKSIKCVADYITGDCLEHSDICYECATIQEGFSSVLQLKDDFYDTK